MKRSLRRFACLGLVFLFSPAGTSIAATVVWDVDSSVSYVRLTIDDQPVTVPGITGSVTMRLRDDNSTTQWTDAGGRRAALDGQITTDYVNFTSIQFVSGAQGILALEQTELRPNPTDWNAATSSYNGTSSALAALGARIRGTYLVTFDAAYMALRGVHLDIGSGVLPLDASGAFAGNQSVFGITTALADTDGLALPLNLGQPVPDLRADPLPPTSGINTSGGLIENLGGRSRKLTYNINVPITISVDTVDISGTATGLIVAYGTIPDQGIPFDFDGDGDVDKDDFAIFSACVTGPAVAGPPAGCTPAQFSACDRDGDNNVDQADFGMFQRCYTGANKPGQPACAQ